MLDIKPKRTSIRKQSLTSMPSTTCLYWFYLSGPKDMSYLNNQSGHRQPHTLIEAHISLPALGPVYLFVICLNLPVLMLLCCKWVRKGALNLISGLSCWIETIPQIYGNTQPGVEDNSISGGQWLGLIVLQIGPPSFFPWLPLAHWRYSSFILKFSEGFVQLGINLEPAKIM